MNTAKIALLAAAGLFTLTACVDGTTGGPDWDLDSADTGYWEEDDPIISEVSYSCNFGNPDMWSYYSLVDGWAGLAVMDIFETGDGNWPDEPHRVWTETHTLNNTAYDESGDWDEWALSLRSVTTINQQVASQTTLFSCAWNDGGSLAFRETIYDDAGRELDCVIWGYQSQQYFNAYLGDSCVCIDNDGSCTN